MNLNICNIGRKIAVVKDSKKYKDYVFSVSEDELKDDKFQTGIDKLHIDEGTFQIIPDKTRDRDTLFICGSAGSGKSYFSAQYLKEYHAMFKNNPVYLISEGSKDPAFDNLKFIKRIKIDDDLLTEPIGYEEFSNCCVVLDDIDAITGKLGKYLYSLRDKLLKNSRKNKVSVISTSHSCTGLDLKSVLNESDTIVFFLRNFNRSLKYLLENYVGLNKDGIKELMKNKSRWTAYVKSFPNTIIQEKDIMCINSIQSF